MTETEGDVQPRWLQWPKPLTASQAEKSLACHGSANLPAALPGWEDGERKAGNAADQGTDVHELLAAASLMKRKEVHGMVAALQYLANLLDQRQWKRMVEESFVVDWLPSKPNTKPDLVLYLQDEIHVIDWKWGKIPVSPVGNTQGKYYGVTAAHLAPKAKGVWFHIVQPMDPDWDPADASHFYTAAELQKFADDCIAADIAIRNGSVTLNPGGHCLFCPANPHSRGTKGSPLCPAQMDELYPARKELRDGLLKEDDDAWR